MKSYFFLSLKGDCDCCNSDDIPVSMIYLMGRMVSVRFVAKNILISSPR